jgi:hypothetical protein
MDIDTKAIREAIGRAFEQGTVIINGDIDLLQSLRDTLDALDTARAEVERLTTKVKELRCIGGHKQADLLEYRNRWTQAAADNKKMREALEKVADVTFCASDIEPIAEFACKVNAIAQEALKETP